MKLFKVYLICILLLPFVGYLIGEDEYYLQTKTNLPIIINSIFGLILFFRVKTIHLTNVTKWLLVIFLVIVLNLFFLSYLRIQIGAVLSVLAYLLVFILFSSYYFQNVTFRKHEIQIILIFVFFCALHLLFGYFTLYFSKQNVFGISFNDKVIGVFYNPAFFTNYLLLCCPFIIVLTSLIKSKNLINRYLGLISIVIIIVFIVTIIYNRNRLGVLTLAILVGYYGYSLLNRKPYLRSLFVLFLCTSVWFFWNFANKNNSSQGRLLIAKITSSIIKDKPWLGVGFNNYKGEYGKYQEEYFSADRPIDEVLLADDNQVAHNELLQIMAELGLLSLIIFYILYKIVRLFIKTNTHTLSIIFNKTKVGVLIAIILLALFSNPFRIPEIAYLISLFVLFFSMLSPNVSLKGRQLPKDFIFSILFAILAVIVFQEYELYKWMLHSKKFISGKIEPFSYFNKQLEGNSTFLYTTSVEMYQIGLYKDALSQVTKLQHLKNDTQTEILLGNIYSKLQKSSESLIHYKSASLMNPKLFRPKYLIMNEYLIMGDTISAKKQAKIILLFPIKIPSIGVDFYRNSAKKVLDLSIYNH